MSSSPGVHGGSALSPSANDAGHARSFAPPIAKPPNANARIIKLRLLNAESVARMNPLALLSPYSGISMTAATPKSINPERENHPFLLTILGPAISDLHQEHVLAILARHGLEIVHADQLTASLAPTSEPFN